MRFLLGRFLLCTLCGAWAAVSNLYGEEAPQNEAIAESIVAREEAASGRAFDPGFRAQVRKALASLPLTALESQTEGRGLVPNSLGDSQADLVYTPVTPCRIIDTRLAGGAIAAGTTRDFSVTGTDLSSQGGSPTGCNVPFGPATAAVINFVAVNPVGAGNLRVTPFGAAIPLASIINYAAVPGLNIANGPAVTMCDPAATTCTADITVRPDVSATDLVADVQGYYHNLQPGPIPSSAALHVPIPAAGLPAVLLTSLFITPKSSGSALVRARGHCSIGPAGASSDDEIELAIGYDSVEAFNGPVSRWGVLRIPVNSGATRLMFSAERVIPVGRGFTYFIGLFGRHALGSVSDDCSGTLVVEGLF